MSFRILKPVTLQVDHGIIDWKHEGKSVHFPFSESAFFPPRKGLLKFQECFSNVLKMQDYEYMYEICFRYVLVDWSHKETQFTGFKLTGRKGDSVCHVWCLSVMYDFTKHYLYQKPGIMKSKGSQKTTCFRITCPTETDRNNRFPLWFKMHQCTCNTWRTLVSPFFHHCSVTVD